MLAVVEAPDTETAIAITARDGREGPVSIWARDPAQGERVARRLPSPSTWVGRHGIAATAVPTRMARHVVPRQLEWRAAWAPGTPELPLDDDLLAAQRTLTDAAPRPRVAPLAGAAGGSARARPDREEGAVKVGAPPHPTSPFSTHPSRTQGPLAQILSLGNA